MRLLNSFEISLARNFEIWDTNWVKRGVEPKESGFYKFSFVFIFLIAQTLFQTSIELFISSTINVRMFIGSEILCVKVDTPAEVSIFGGCPNCRLPQRKQTLFHVLFVASSFN